MLYEDVGPFRISFRLKFLLFCLALHVGSFSMGTKNNLIYRHTFKDMHIYAAKNRPTLS